MPTAVNNQIYMAQDVVEMCFTNIRIYAARKRPETKRNDKYPPCTVKPWWVGGVVSVSDFLLPSLAGSSLVPGTCGSYKEQEHKGQMHRKFSSGIQTKMLGRLYPANIAAQLKRLGLGVGRVAVKQCNGSSWWEIPVVSTLTLMMAR